MARPLHTHNDHDLPPSLPYIPVRIVEAHFLDEHVDKEVTQSGGKGGKLIATAHGMLVEWKHASIDDQPNHQTIKDTSLQHLLVLLPVHLKCHGEGERGREGWREGEEGGREKKGRECRGRGRR